MIVTFGIEVLKTTIQVLINLQKYKKWEFKCEGFFKNHVWRFLGFKQVL